MPKELNKSLLSVCRAQRAEWALNFTVCSGQWMKWTLNFTVYSAKIIKWSLNFTTQRKNWAFNLIVCSIQRIFFSFVRWKLQPPQRRWQCIAGPSGFRRACGLRECGLARFRFWVARRWGRTAVDVLLSDCQYRKGTAPYGQCRVWNIGDSWGGCGLPWVWTLSLVPVWLTGSRGQPCCIVGACASTCCVAWPWGWPTPQGSWWTYPLAPLLCLPLLESQQPYCQAHYSGMESIAGWLHGLYKVRQEQQTGR